MTAPSMPEPEADFYVETESWRRGLYRCYRTIQAIRQYATQGEFEAMVRLERLRKAELRVASLEATIATLKAEMLREKHRPTRASVACRRSPGMNAGSSQVPVPRELYDWAASLLTDYDDAGQFSTHQQAMLGRFRSALAAPQPVVLTDERIDDMWVQAGKRENGLGYMATYLQARVFARAVLATQHPTAPAQVCGEAELLPPRTYTHAEVREMLNCISVDAAQYGLEVVNNLLDGTMGLRASPAPVPAQADGWQWVPKVPTPEMTRALMKILSDMLSIEMVYVHMQMFWDACLAASPPHPGSTEPQS